MNCNKEAVQLMHLYLDGDLPIEQEQRLRSHLQACPSCQNHFQELKRTTALVKNDNELHVSEDFTASIMNELPKEKKRVRSKKWFRAHPALTAAAIFFIFMFSGVISAWNADSQLSVSKQQNLIIENETVIVPEGVTVDGELVVKNGNLKIDGAVNGDVVVINGEHLMASAGEVNGELEEVDQMFEWIWYNIKDFAKSILSVEK